jgi:hypothetical protein
MKKHSFSRGKTDFFGFFSRVFQGNFAWARQGIAKKLRFLREVAVPFSLLLSAPPARGSYCFGWASESPYIYWLSITYSLLARKNAMIGADSSLISGAGRSRICVR